MSPEKPRSVELPTPFRVVLATPRRLRWLLFSSLLLHLLLTPIGAYIGLMSLLFTDDDKEIIEEELSTIPIELFDASEETQEPSADSLPPLPKEDPVALIDELIPEPPVLPVAPKVTPTAEPATTVEPPKPEATIPKPEREEPEPATPEPSSSTDVEPPPDAGAPRPVASNSKAEDAKPPRKIEGPLEASGKASDVVKDEAYVSIALYADRIREHMVGKRIAKLLPSLPQWKDFFPNDGLNPIRDFDRVVVVGPSFYHSENVVAVLKYNTTEAKVRSAIDTLVARRGEWLKDTRVPAAKAYADRADRVFVLPSPGLVVVVPPNKAQQIIKAKGLGIPTPKGPEALVATLKHPHKPLARYNLEIPKSLKEAKLRLTPLPKGEVRVELQATDESPEQAKKTALQLTTTINALADFTAGLTGFLELAGLGRTVQLPRIELRAHGSEIYGEQVLTQEQVEFLLSRLERQALLWAEASVNRSKPRGAGTGERPKLTVPATPRGGVTPAP